MKTTIGELRQVIREEVKKQDYDKLTRIVTGHKSYKELCAAVASGMYGSMFSRKKESIRKLGEKLESDGYHVVWV